MTKFFKSAVFLFLFLSGAIYAHASTGDELPVKFQEYSEKTLMQAKKSGKPIFMIFSAEWCYWCKAFEENALQDEQVYTYLNSNYINIFVDADIRNDLLMTFEATLLPFIVFLKPDGSVFSKFGGTLRAEDFAELVRTIDKKIKAGIAPIKTEAWDTEYAPPEKLDLKMLKTFKADFVDTALENFDREDYGLGSTSKAITPLTFLYLMESQKDDDGKEVLDFVKSTLTMAVDSIYDPYEGGFFRYAETRSWDIPHYEKMVDTNCAAILLLLKVNSISPSAQLSKAAEKTIDYMSSTLFDEETESFLSFQEADHSYYLLEGKFREKFDPPLVSKKIFTDRIAVSLVYLLEAFTYIENEDFREKTKSSIDFLAAMTQAGEVAHYYSTNQEEWAGGGKLSDHAYLGLLFSRAHSVFKETRYLKLAKKVLKTVSERFYSKNLKIFSENPLITTGELEKLLELNAAILLAWQTSPEIKPNGRQLEMIDGVMTYFSGLGSLLTDKAWAAKDFRFLEKYARFMTVVDNHMATTAK